MGNDKPDRYKADNDNEFIIIADKKESGRRLDFLIASHAITECSRALAVKLIREGLIRVDGRIKKPGYRLHEGDRVHGHIKEPEPVSFEPEPIILDLIYEDKDILVINKAPGLVVHPAPGHYTGTIVNALLYHCPDLKGIGGELRPGIVHRLDKDTSGILVVAKNSFSLAVLGSQFQDRTIKKKYTALVHGEMKADSGSINLPIGRHPVDRKKMSTISKTGKPAETLWTVKQRLPETTLIDIDLKTGRTHQIRVHFSSAGHPVVGDQVYCSKSGKKHSDSVFSIIKDVSRQMLHAQKICLKHPKTGSILEFEAPLAPDFKLLVSKLESLNV
ncbi:RluA family pseudouridine synthase [Desulfonema limicola]|uniref:RluA family pseudouridine synthase n=1 Tax=Desulfonema limicola TaxID=45656 RepID=UPI001A9C0337|nr:RluA family pseudouridine synthase [Desulfonema limicola]